LDFFNHWDTAPRLDYGPARFCSGGLLDAQKFCASDRANRLREIKAAPPSSR
jgi:hypothetical protein